MDEQPVQLLKETRNPIPATMNHPRRVDYEYERAGTTRIFMFTEPLPGWRDVSVCPRRTKVDWALEMEEFLRTRYAKAKKVLLVCDNSKYISDHTIRRRCASQPTEHQAILLQRLGLNLPKNLPLDGRFLKVM